VLFYLLLAADFRISETLSVRVHEVWDGAMLPSLYIPASCVKGKRRAREAVLSPRLEGPLSAWIAQMKDNGWLDPKGYLFRSRKTSERLNRQHCRSRQQLYRPLQRILEEAAHNQAEQGRSEALTPRRAAPIQPQQGQSQTRYPRVRTLSSRERV
jgi:hypothetical protein